MHPILRSTIAVVAGWLGGSVVNLGLVKLGHTLLPIEGVGPNDMDALAAVMPNLEAQYFIFPFLAHALGTLVGAAIAAKIATNHKMRHALIIGMLFLAGGIWVNYILPGPTWFAVADILLAYIPMALIGGKIGRGFSS